MAIYGDFDDFLLQGDQDERHNDDSVEDQVVEGDEQADADRPLALLHHSERLSAHVELGRLPARFEEPPAANLRVRWQLLLQVKLVVIVLEAAQFLAAHLSLFHLFERFSLLFCL